MNDEKNARNKKVSVTFIFNDKVNDLDISCEPILKNADNNEKLNFEYSGKHDNGILPEEKEGTYYDLVQSLIDAKHSCDTFLTNEMNKESMPPEKRVKHYDEES